MTVGTRIDSSAGVNTTNNTQGLNVAKDNQNYGFSPWRVESLGTVTAATTLGIGDVGVTTISGTGAITVIMPSASLCPGAEFTLRTLSNHAHLITSSQEAPGTPSGGVFSDRSGGTKGSLLTFTTTLGSAVVLKSDGFHFLVMGGTSGSVALSGT